MQTEDKGNYGAGFDAISSKVCTDVVRWFLCGELCLFRP